MSAEVETLIKKFVSDLEIVVRARALEAIEDTIGKKVMKSMKVPLLRDPGAPMAKRSPAELDLVKRAILAALNKEGGLSSEEIQKATKKTGEEITLPLKQLLVGKTLRAEGVARGRRYWVK